MLPKILQPISCEDLTRIGANHDGGYVLSKRIINNTETILTFGLADEFSFEINFNKLKKNIKIFAFDHTVDRLYWVKHFFKWSWWAIRYRKSFGRAFTFLKYKSFVIDYLSPKTVLLPPHYANAHLCLSEFCIFHYKWSYTGKYIDAKKQVSIRWNDPKINVKWPIKKPILSNRDSNSKFL